ncbi:O-antigen ligase family protein [Weizmannia agrestimuris]|uniref:O-antigen ligase family protein n=1 Tax=Weizmannia agrestimuris TaxID=2941342 RepID=UPI00203DB622|nr:O-antigen ligase family protein [Weizmannia agrestimuris]
MEEKYRVIYFLYYIGVFTISFDIFLNIEIVGFSFRFAQLVFIFPIVFGILISLHLKKIIKPLSIYSLLLWVLFVLLFIPNTTYLNRSIGYALFAVFNLALVFSTVQIFNTKNLILKLVKIYVYSFVFVAIFGIFQFVSPILGIGRPLIQQWWFSNIPRVNGFSYEPSYYATYMLIGWSFLIYLYFNKSTILTIKQYRIFIFLITLALVLCSSRLGWIMMVICLLSYPFIFLRDLLFKGVIKIKALRYTTIIGIIGILFCIYFIKFVDFNKIRFLLAGLGIGGSPDYSSTSRINSALDTFTIFLKSPIIGYSLGGITPAIGKLIYHVNVTNQNLAESIHSASVFLESLAAVGIIGFLPFIFFIVSIIIKPLKLSNQIYDKDLSLILKGLAYSLIFLLIILQTKQNILRLYLWLHIAILLTSYSVALKTYKPILRK